MSVVRKTSPPHRRTRRGETRVTAKNQVTIPAAALREAGLAPGDVLVARSDAAGSVLLERVDDPLTRFAGSISYPKGYLETLRSEWDG